MKTDLNPDFEMPDNEPFKRTFCGEVAATIVLAAFITVALLSLWGILMDKLK